MIAHNCRIGAHSALAGASAIAGSSVLGKRCILGGRAGLTGHITLCDDVVVLGTSFISHSITKPGVYSSALPSEEAGVWRRLVAALQATRRDGQAPAGGRETRRIFGVGAGLFRGHNYMSQPVSLDIMGVMRLLPHRYPFLLVDRVLECNKGDSIRAIKNVTDQRAVLSRAFSASPRDARSDDHRGAGAGRGRAGLRDGGRDSRRVHRFYFVGIDKARFRKPVEPGDQLILTAKLERQMRGIWKFSTVAYVGDDEVTSAEMMVRPKPTRPLRRCRARVSNIDPRAIVSPKARAGRGCHGGRLRRHRRRCAHRRRDLGRTARGDQRPDHHRCGQQDFPVRIDRRCAAGSQVQGRADAPRDRRPQRVPRMHHHEPRHGAGWRRHPSAATTCSCPIRTWRTTATSAIAACWLTTPRWAAT